MNQSNIANSVSDISERVDEGVNVVPINGMTMWY